MNLDDNIGIQIGGFLLTLGCMGTWLANFIAIGLQPSIMPMFGSGASDFLPLLPTILFNYGFVATIPSWLNEKAPGVSVNATILLAQAMATVQLLILAIFGGLSISIGDSSLSSAWRGVRVGALPPTARKRNHTASPYTLTRLRFFASHGDHEWQLC